MTQLLERLQKAVLPRYLVKHELGRGGMSVVFLAWDRKHECDVALKVLRPELAASLGSSRFLQEIKTAARLKHPYILKLHDSGEAKGLVYYAMPFVETESLRQRLIRLKRLPIADALRITQEVAEALDYAHRMNVLHRDIKPENILFEGGHAVVSDFGIALAISEAGTRETGTGIVLGTVEYMSPEQAAGARDLDGRTDLYGLGVVLHEMLVGETPRLEPDGSPPTLERTHPEIPAEIARIVKRSLAVARADRFASAQEFAAALREVAGGRRPPRWMIVASVSAVLAVALIGAAIIWGRGGTTPPPPPPPSDLASATRSPVALAHLVKAQERFWVSDLDAAAAEIRSAIAADSDFAPAYHRLSVVETWRWDYPAALKVVQLGLARSQRFPPRWRQMLQAERHYILRSADSAISDYQILATDYPNLVDAQLGLAEALYHYGGLVGAKPTDAQWPFEQVERLDGAFAPIYHHLLALALYQRDESRARTFAAQVLPTDREHAWTELIVPLTFGNRRARARVLAQLRTAERRVISLLVAHLGHAGTDLPTVDTLGIILLAPDRPPADRERGAQYRLVALAGQGRWTDAVSAWEPAAGRAPFDRWIIQAYFAGYPAQALAEPMFRWAELQVTEGRAPDFTQSPSDDAQQAFQALVHRTTLEGDSSAVRRLLRLLDRAAPRADASDPLPVVLRAALLSRLAWLRGDTAETIRLLQRSVSRAAEPLGTFYPLLTMAPERMRLAELLLGAGDRKQARAWLASFENIWSFGDVLYGRRVACLQAQDTLSTSSSARPRACSR